MATVHTSSTEDEVLVVNGSAMLTYAFMTHQIGSTSGSGTFIITESTSGSDTINGIYFDPTSCGSDFTLIAPLPMVPVGSGMTNAYMGSATIGGTCAGSQVMIVFGPSGTGTGSTSTCNNYTFYATFEPHLMKAYSCLGTVNWSASAGPINSNFTLTGTGVGSVTPDARVDSAGGDAQTSDAPGSGTSKDGGNSGEKARQTYYACSTGAPAGAAPVALALFALRRRRKLRA